MVAGRRRGSAVVPLLSGLQPKLRLEPGAASLVARLPLLLLLLVDLPLSGASAPLRGVASVDACFAVVGLPLAGASAPACGVAVLAAVML